MSRLLTDLLLSAAEQNPSAPCLSFLDQEVDYSVAAGTVARFAGALVGLGVQRLDRVAVCLPKQFESVFALFGASLAGCVFVPVNPLLKADQIGHIIRDCEASVLVTSFRRATELRAVTEASTGPLRHLILTDSGFEPESSTGPNLHSWGALLESATERWSHRSIDIDMAGLFYTSGSTGRPKGVMVSHRNLVSGAGSVSQYLQNTECDRLLSVLPLSFDYGFSQLSTAFKVGASVDLMEYLLPKDVVLRLAKRRITGLAGVPSLWSQLSVLEWPAGAADTLRYITNSGGAMPTEILGRLRALLPKTKIFLMYGLTEAFRSTYLPPSELDQRPQSIGKAIPNEEVLVVRPDGSLCEADEPGELVHRGALVSLGYWNDAGKTAERFKPVPTPHAGLVLPEIAVWSGDTVRMDAEGFLYFVSRRDEMIKTSGYRVSPTEVEEVILASGIVSASAVVGVPHPKLGQAIIAVALAMPGSTQDSEALLEFCRTRLPLFMLPQQVLWRDALPCNANGKFDRLQLRADLANLYT